ncbi:DUF3332 domain-containing protein [Vibrio paucivorans]|uniref:DUF3332 domain-containing protein n=1 Tax=Vibrio paucivorans TaxID=2829489 RepID=A0A9X3CBB5_9VIBR|nr:DUF3332 domain-containing protein [Vibrio paucivorans]MCW8332569.1 DUF3332 domain-containing protein [Vibrio paucivorans]
MKFKTLKIALIAAVGATSLTGCMGQMATTGMVSKFNLQVVDNRYGREGMFILLSPVYGIASVADLFIFNAVEFWTGTNPISGKSPAVVDTPMDAIIKVNKDLDSSLTEVPLQTNNENVEKATLKQIDENTMQMDISYIDGTQQVLRGEKGEDSVAFYLDDEYITTVSNAELDSYVASAQI